MALSTEYDDIFNEYRDELPLSFLRALAKRESDFNPESGRNEGTNESAKGLLQVMGIVRRGYNERYGTSYDVNDLFDPRINVMIACDLINRIVRSYRKFHPRTLATDWNSKRWVQMLIFGWNAGYSELSGVGYVVGTMEKANPTIDPSSVNIDSVHQLSKLLPKASKNLRNTKKVVWGKGVASLYFNEASITPDDKSIAPSDKPRKRFLGLLVGGFIAAITTIVIAKRR